MKRSCHAFQAFFFLTLTRVDGGLLRLYSTSSSNFLSAEPSPGATLVQSQQTQPDIAIWDETNKLAVELEVGICFIWVISVTSMPLLIRYLSGQPFTKTQASLAGLMWVAIFGGLFMFTNIILFQSAHFSEIRPLNIIECIYLMSQVITTVGYGDITPAKGRGQVFVGMYVLCSFFVIAMVVSDVVALIMSTAQKYEEKVIGDKLGQEHVEVNFKLKGKASADKDAKRKGDTKQKTQLVAELQKPALAPLACSFCFYSFFAITWVFFFHFYPGEGKTWLQAIYMSVITLSTVGFGAFTPNTTGGMIFASFWMIFGSAALVGVVGAFTQLIVASQEFERFDPESHQKAVEVLKQDGHQEMDEAQFIKFTLVQKGLCTADDVDDLLASFQILAEGKDGRQRVCIDALEKLEST